MKIKNFRLGKTGNFPRGHADATDDGEIRMAVFVDQPNAIVRLEFGTAVSWLGLPASHCRELAAVLLEKAEELERQLN